MIEKYRDFAQKYVNFSKKLQEKVLPNAIYYGELLNDLKHGCGSVLSINQNIGLEVTNDDCVYAGAWQNDLKHGQGIIKYKNNNIYEGYFLNDV